MTNEAGMDRAVENSDKELWERPATEAGPSASVFVTKEGALGICFDNYCMVRPIEHWHRTERDLAAQADYAVKLREAYESLVIAANRIDVTFDGKDGGRWLILSDNNCSEFIRVLRQATKDFGNVPTPTEAMRQVKEKAWEEGVDMALRSILIGGLQGQYEILKSELGIFPLYQMNSKISKLIESILTELRKKEGV